MFNPCSQFHKFLLFFNRVVSKFPISMCYKQFSKPPFRCYPGKGKSFLMCNMACGQYQIMGLDHIQYFLHLTAQFT